VQIELGSGKGVGNTDSEDVVWSPNITAAGVGADVGGGIGCCAIGTTPIHPLVATLTKLRVRFRSALCRSVMSQIRS
jgi:hypothetical protein